MTVLERFDSRLKLVGFTVLIFSISFSNTFIALGAGLLETVILTLTSGISFRNSVKILKAPVLFVLLMSPFLIMTPLLIPIIALKSVSIFMLFTILVETSGTGEMFNALRSFGISGKLITILSTTYRYIFIFREDLRKLVTASGLRGYSIQKGLRHGSTSGDILLTLLIRSYEQSQRVNAAMKLRGFTGELTINREYSIGVKDIITLFVLLLFSVAVILLERVC